MGGDFFQRAGVDVISKREEIIIQGLSHIDIRVIMESGQFHLWEEEEDGFFLVEHEGKLCAIKSEEDRLIFQLTDLEEIEKIWWPWLDLDTDYGKIQEALRFDPHLQEAMEESPGLRILRQSPYEASSQFIMSSNNNMKRMKKSFRAMSQEYGTYLGEYYGQDRYSLPGSAKLAKIDPQDLREKAGVGYRDRALVQWGKDLVEGNFSIDKAEASDDDALFLYLQELRGVGPKVAQCIMLYGYYRMSAFPIDTWVKKIMTSLYPLEGKSNKEISVYAKERFGPFAGFAQQLLFIYARAHPEEIS